MTLSRFFQGQDTGGGGGVDRLFFTKADPQPFRHPLLTHLQHTLHSQLDGTGSVSGNLGGKQGFGSGIGHDYFYSTPHRHGWSGGGGGGGGHHHHHGGGGGKHKSNSTALSALTLLAFLFFLNLLQNCLREQMETMNPTVMVMTAGAVRERLEKSAEQQADAETEPFIPEERVRVNASSSSSSSSIGANFNRQHHRRPNYAYDDNDDSYENTERSRFQRISLASHSSSRESTTTTPRPKSLVFRTRF